MRNNKPASSTPITGKSPNAKSTPKTVVSTPTPEGQQALAAQMTKQEWGWCTADRKFLNALMENLVAATEIAEGILKRQLKTTPAATVALHA